jgi:uncharacterized protein YdeI (YjbR/CyaY-like superfamily)
MIITKTFYAEDRHAWRSWLQFHHASETEIWLVFFKKHTNKPSIIYQEALEEALCFGWIDGVRQKLDDDRFAQRFTPRRKLSRWSDVNKRLVARLTKEGRMTAAGLSVVDFPPLDSEAPFPVRKELPLPNWLESALKINAVWANFQKLPPSHQRRYIGWISEAKREKTRQKRIQEAIALLKENKRIGIGPGEVRK